MRVRVLVVGSGAREHALAWRLASDGDAVFAAPGNAGMAAAATCLPLGPEAPALLHAVSREAIDLVVIGPEAPLVAGLADGLRAGGAAVLGPGAAAAAIEGSKSWAMAFCHRHGIPAPQAVTAATAAEAAAVAARCALPVAIKADGLMAGKGVVVAEDRPSALAAAADFAARGPVVFEEFLEGAEVSAFALCDGRRAAFCGLSRDHKRLLPGNRGPMTGGMGAFAPVAVGDPGLEVRVRDLLQRAVEGMAAEGRPFVGFLFAGLMLTAAGPKVLEFNCRLGDPEAQVLLPLWAEAPGPRLLAAARGALDDGDLPFRPGAAVAVVLASPGYPEAPRPGQEIAGLGPDGQLPGRGELVFHAGCIRRDGRWQTAGGRVLTCVARAATLGAARDAAYGAAAAAAFPGAVSRADVAAGS
jgi:phosphoribosylamine--glycine ligase